MKVTGGRTQRRCTSASCRRASAAKSSSSRLFTRLSILAAAGFCTRGAAGARKSASGLRAHMTAVSGGAGHLSPAPTLPGQQGQPPAGHSHRLKVPKSESIATHLCRVPRSAVPRCCNVMTALWAQEDSLLLQSMLLYDMGGLATWMPTICGGPFWSVLILLVRLYSARLASARGNDSGSVGSAVICRHSS